MKQSSAGRAVASLVEVGVVGNGDSQPRERPQERLMEQSSVAEVVVASLVEVEVVVAVVGKA